MKKNRQQKILELIERYDIGTQEALLQKLAEILPVDGVRLSIMRQFTPEFVSKEEFPELCRRLTGFEYESVLREADRLGFIGYSQAAGSADKGYTPEFNTDEAFAILDCGGEKVT